MIAFKRRKTERTRTRRGDKEGEVKDSEEGEGEERSWKRFMFALNISRLRSK